MGSPSRGASASTVTSTLTMPKPRSASRPATWRRKCRLSDALPARVGIREMHADVAEPGAPSSASHSEWSSTSPSECALHAERVRNAHPAQRHMVAGPQRRARRSPGRFALSPPRGRHDRRGKLGGPPGSVILMLSRRPGTSSGRSPRASTAEASSVTARSRSMLSAERLPQHAIAEHLRCQRAPQARARYRSISAAVAPRALERVANGRRQQSADRIVANRSMSSAGGRPAAGTAGPHRAPAPSPRRAPRAPAHPARWHRQLAPRATAAVLTAWVTCLGEPLEPAVVRSTAPRRAARMETRRAARPTTTTAPGGRQRQVLLRDAGRRCAGHGRRRERRPNSRARRVIPLGLRGRCSSAGGAAAGGGGTTWKKVSLPPIMPRSVRARSSMAARPS